LIPVVGHFDLLRHFQLVNLLSNVIVNNRIGVEFFSRLLQQYFKVGLARGDFFLAVVKILFDARLRD
jgi:hypothetical protein